MAEQAGKVGIAEQAHEAIVPRTSSHRPRHYHAVAYEALLLAVDELASRAITRTLSRSAWRE